jgi:hypothetical protein
MPKPVGGRGNSAPYISTHVRIPEDIKPYIELIKQQYFDGTLVDFGSFKNLLDRCGNEGCSLLPLTPLENAQDFADKLINQRKSARFCLAKLLNFIYCKDR